MEEWKRRRKILLRLERLIDEEYGPVLGPVIVTKVQEELKEKFRQLANELNMNMSRLLRILVYMVVEDPSILLCYAMDMIIEKTRVRGV